MGLWENFVFTPGLGLGLWASFSQMHLCIQSFSLRHATSHEQELSGLTVSNSLPISEPDPEQAAR